MKATKDIDPDEAMAYFADRLERMAERGRSAGMSTFVLVTMYDPLSGCNSFSVRSIGNHLELSGALRSVDFSLYPDE